MQVGRFADERKAFSFVATITYTKEDANGEEKDVFFLNRFNVFNVAQLDGYEKAEEAEEKPSAINENSTIAQIIANTDV